MDQVISCLTTEHDWRLVGLAVVICFLVSVVAINMLQRACVLRAGARLVWLGLGAVAAGFGISATHFVAMLAYEPGVPTGYDVSLTLLSLLIAIAVTGAGLAVAVYRPFRWAPAIGGAIVGLGIAAMHFTGMTALELPGRLSWSADIFAASIVFGTVFGGAALWVAARGDGFWTTLSAALLLTLAIATMHFTAMGAATIVPDPTRTVHELSLSPSSLGLMTFGIAVGLLGMCLVAALSDRKNDDRLREQKILLDTALQNMAEALCMYDPEGRIVLSNGRFRELMGLPAEELQRMSLLDLLKIRKKTGNFAPDPEEYFNRILTRIRAGQSNTNVLQMPNGTILRIAERPMTGGGWVATLQDVTAAHKAEARIAHLASHDPLTDLANRAFFRDELEKALMRVHRGEQIAVLCLDLGHFKIVNDSLGHPVGDALLKTVAERLRACVRETDILARLGGDEFAIIQTSVNKQPAESAAFAGRIIEALSMPYDVQGHHVVVGTSVGISIAPADGVEADQLLKNADMALHRAKSDGRGTYRFFEANMDSRAQARRLLELGLRGALARGEFELYYQPIQDISDGKIIAFEALLRWNDPARGIILPGEFIELAEQTGLIVPIGEWVLRTACQEAATWPPNIRVAVNLSVLQFRNRKLVSTVVNALSASRLAPSRLELEITESVLLQDSENTLATLRSLRELGVRIAMDDFGTGNSSLSYLRSYPFDKIKIDQSFIHELANAGDAEAIVRAIARLGKTLGISTTAEGVETSEQLDMLRSEGCDEVQSYLFSKPCPAKDVAALLVRQSKAQGAA